ncbi:MAG: hypothetical protein IPI23_12900 [Bacteroidetes bacterium]|nr:hypothetical protein [Bacteroidota bacterium]
MKNENLKFNGKTLITLRLRFALLRAALKTDHFVNQIYKTKIHSVKSFPTYNLQLTTFNLLQSHFCYSGTIISTPRLRSGLARTFKSSHTFVPGTIISTPSPGRPSTFNFNFNF